MAGALGSHTLGSFQLSGQAAGGGLTTLTAVESGASDSTSRASGGDTNTLTASESDASATAGATGGEVATLAGAGRQTENWHGTLGTFALGSGYLSGEVTAGERQSMTATERDSDPTARSTGDASLASLTATERDSDPTARSSGGATTTLDTSLGTATDATGVLGVHQLGASYLSGDVAAGGQQSMTASESAASDSTARSSGGDTTPIRANVAGTREVGRERLGDFALGGDIEGGTARSTGGDTQSLATDAFGEMSRQTRLGRFTLGAGSGLGTRTALTSSTGGEVQSLEAIDRDAIRFTSEWTVEGRLVSATVTETRTWDELNLTFRVDKTTLESAVRQLNDDSEKLEVVQRSDGTFRTIDRVGGANTYTIRAPTDRRDVRPVETWLVDGYDQSVIDQNAQEYEVSVTLKPAEAKTHD